MMWWRTAGVSLEELPIDEAARETVRLLSKDKSHEEDEEGYDIGYFTAIAQHPHAMLVSCLTAATTSR